MGNINLAPTTPSPTGISRKDIERIAARFAEKVGYVPGASIAAVVESLGGTIETHDFALLIHIGSLVVRSQRDFSIHLPDYTSPCRDRFIIAHELGHYVLHSRCGQFPIHISRIEDRGICREADWFAFALLMPELSFRAAWDAHESIIDLAILFDVPIGAAQVRAKQLGLHDWG